MLSQEFQWLLFRSSMSAASLMHCEIMLISNIAESSSPKSPSSSLLFRDHLNVHQYLNIQCRGVDAESVMTTPDQQYVHARLRAQPDDRLIDCNIFA
jgi:hypothetical protein